MPCRITRGKWRPELQSRYFLLASAQKPLLRTSYASLLEQEKFLHPRAYFCKEYEMEAGRNGEHSKKHDLYTTDQERGVMVAINVRNKFYNDGSKLRMILVSVSMH